jgi:hypothetical protein
MAHEIGSSRIADPKSSLQRVQKKLKSRTVMPVAIREEGLVVPGYVVEYHLAVTSLDCFIPREAIVVEDHKAEDEPCGEEDTYNQTAVPL